MVLLDRATTTPSVPPTASSWVLTAGGGPSDAAFQAGAALASLDTLARAQVIRRSRSHVTNTLELPKLPDVVHDVLVSGTLSAGHARTLVTAYDPAEVARHIVENGLSVGQAEALAQTPAAERPSVSRPATAGKDPDVLLLEKQLSDAIGDLELPRVFGRDLIRLPC